MSNKKSPEYSRLYRDDLCQNDLQIDFIQFYFSGLAGVVDQKIRYFVIGLLHDFLVYVSAGDMVCFPGFLIAFVFRVLEFVFGYFRIEKIVFQVFLVVDEDVFKYFMGVRDFVLDIDQNLLSLDIQNTSSLVEIRFALEFVAVYEPLLIKPFKDVAVHDLNGQFKHFAGVRF